MSDSKKTGFVIKLSSETVQKLKEDTETANKPKVSDVPNTLDTSVSKEKSEQSALVSTSDLSEPEKSDIGTKTNLQNLPQDTLKSDSDLQQKSAEVIETQNAATWGDYAPYITYEGETAIYTDPSTKIEYLWSEDSKSWIQKDPNQKPIDDASKRVYSYENDTHIYTEEDGSKSFWDAERKAWFPKVDDDFLAHYQMSYGFVDNTSKSEPKEEKQPERKPAESCPQKRKAEPAKWFDASHENNTKVYVTNLPLDLTEEEFVDLMQKCGLVMRDPSNQKMKVKLYTDKENNCFKGDALCTYIKIESVDLALKLLDGSDVKGSKISVQRAHFQMKGDYNPALKPKKKKKKELEKLKRMQEKLFDWRPEKIIGEKSKTDRVVIIKNLFDPILFDTEVQLILDYQQDLREECSKCGEVKKVVLYDRHPEGVAQVTMKEPEQAEAVIQLINGRWFGKRKLTAEIWDGRTKYRIAETDADINQRINKWEKFLEGEETTDGKSKAKLSPTKDGVAEESEGSGKEEKQSVQSDKEEKQSVQSGKEEKQSVQSGKEEKQSVQSEAPIKETTVKTVQSEPPIKETADKTPEIPEKPKETVSMEIEKDNHVFTSPFPVKERLP